MKDNSFFFEFHLSLFVVKDHQIEAPLFRGPAEAGLYKFKASKSLNKRARKLS